MPGDAEPTEAQKQHVRKLALEKLESRKVQTTLIKISRAMWDAYSLHSCDSGDLESETRLSILTDIDKALWPQNGQAPQVPAILKYKNPTTYIKHRMINALDSLTKDEGQITAGDSPVEQQWIGGDAPPARNLLSDDADNESYESDVLFDDEQEPPATAAELEGLDAEDVAALTAEEPLPLDGIEPPELPEAGVAAEGAVASELEDATAEVETIDSRQRPPRGKLTKSEKWRQGHILPGGGEGETDWEPDMKFADELRWGYPELSSYERRILIARYEKWHKTRAGEWRPSVSIRKVAEKFGVRESKMRRDLERLLVKMGEK